ncbi:hypothetical protein AB0N05_37510 [Nocardia sp. NPDC051030]|uniref:hypothetical protein n=1 Tax=Nocardia sp. NPDC051030 TaxID=3155162 RepID=UPI00342EDFB4
MTWQELIGELNEIDWHCETFMASQAPSVEQLLRQASSGFTSSIRPRIEEILSDAQLFAELRPYTEYPRTLMDKFTLYRDPKDSFRLRLHRFWPGCIAGSAIEKVHSHKWHMSTVLVAGSYVERRFTVASGDDPRRVVLAESSRETRTAGQSSSLPIGIPHQVHNPSFDEPCLTLFVRGPSLIPAARIYDEDTGEFYDTYSPDRQLRHALAVLRTGDARFHPMPEIDSRTSK